LRCSRSRRWSPSRSCAGPTPPPPRLPAAGQGAAASGPLDGTLAPTAGSFVGYRVRETVAGVGLNEAIGRTAQVDGTARIERGRTVGARLETDTRTLRSDEARRDEALRGRGLETDRYPLRASCSARLSASRRASRPAGA
jgi:polyisoprenoid-binding protein YceI